MKLSEAKQQASETNQQAADVVTKAMAEHVARLRDTKAYRDLKAMLDKEPGDEKRGYLRMDEDGWLCYELTETLDETLCTDDAGNEDSEVARAVLEDITAGDWNFKQERGARNATDWILTMTFGEPVLVNVPPERNCYAVFSHDLKLKLDGDAVKSEEHALMLVEQAMRQVGWFGDVVSTDYNGCPSRLNISKEVREMTDEQLQAAIDEIEKSDESDESEDE